MLVGRPLRSPTVGGFNPPLRPCPRLHPARRTRPRTRNTRPLSRRPTELTVCFGPLAFPHVVLRPALLARRRQQRQRRSRPRPARAAAARPYTQGSSEPERKLPCAVGTGHDERRELHYGEVALVRAP